MTTSTQLAGGSSGHEHLRPLIDTALDGFAKGTIERNGPLPARGPGADGLHSGAGGFPEGSCPETGVGSARALTEMSRWFSQHAIDPADPACAAHLHTPPLAVAVAADTVAGAVNSSLDSWDQGPSGVAIEAEVVRAMTSLIGYSPETATGAMTSGGTESNLTGLMLAREHAGRAANDAAVRGRPRILCSADAHFSVARSAGVLGLGEDAAVEVGLDSRRRMDPDSLRRALDAVDGDGDVPIAVVATAGTTDLGTIDPLAEIAAITEARGLWLHVDAAYGGGAVFSRRLAPLLDGLERADSVAIDLHKLGWQPVAAGLFCVRDATLFEPLQRRVAYLNAEDDEQAGYRSLLGRSLRTTRRADAFKVAVTLRALGRAGLGALVDRCHDLARHAASRVRGTPRLALHSDPALTTVVFRYLPRSGDPDSVNARLRRRLMDEGRAVVGRTEFAGAVQLKLTLLNPNTTEADIDALLDAVVAAGDKECA
ncbi:L-2,4-diaminobutyrate decarboxylase [Halopolyspora algeriensis]|uniref:L-2,4-diaminobutyrate decarboxylase n=1 Tax=Halopolyspora algeriensis TaxID=1500506 RepID=A0A368VME5_9ACTN|nr:pyridoxal-dependent decarboxylase [Halopolyspora algeriensis]RCW42891.1 L-2,4-diaminobutyrate decarboxylase [Halopolyspora algeriensis]TQM56640.1 L-2,4-diaminobutyrate decarboxylase [Halopolyspora algeriensis]